MRRLLAAILALSCGRPVVSTCRSAPFTIDSEVELDCGSVDRSVDLARRLYSGVPRQVLGIPEEQGTSFEDPWPMFDGGFDERFAGRRVVVVLGDTVECRAGPFDVRHVGGCTDEGVVYLPSAQQVSFGHELMHVLECVDGNCHNTKHVGWNENGYENFGIAYQYGVTDGGIFASAQLPEFSWCTYRSH